MVDFGMGRVVSLSVDKLLDQEVNIMLAPLQSF